MVNLQISEIHEYLILSNSQQAVVNFDFRKLQDNFPQVSPLKIYFPKKFQDESNFLENSQMTFTQSSPQISTDEYITSLGTECVKTKTLLVFTLFMPMSLGTDSVSAMTIQSKFLHDLKVH